MNLKPDIDRLINVGDYQRAYNWSMRFSQVPNVLRTIVNSEEFNARCTSVTMPVLTNAPITVNNRGIKIKIPGISSYSENISLTMNETTDAYVRRVIEVWREACWSYKNGKTVNYSDIIGTIRFDLLEGDHDIVSTSSYYVYHAWMSNYTFPQLGSDNNIWAPTITLSYNYYTPSNS